MNFLRPRIGKLMSIITLISDLGTKDHYSALVKAKILSQAPNSQIIDITHDVAKHNIGQAAYILKSIVMEFPEDSTHIVSVGSKSSVSEHHIAIRYRNRNLILPDNGMFMLFAEYRPDKIVRIQLNLSTGFLAFPMKDVYAPAAAHLANGGDFDGLGPATPKIVEALSVKPTFSEDSIHGQIIYVDDYGNAVSNITEALIQEVGKGKAYSVGMSHQGANIHELSKAYDQNPLGDRLALINGSGHLEVAVNQGRADHLLGLKVDEPIIVVFDA